MLNDVSIEALHAALNGLSAREAAIANNVANVNTPYYTARQVDFERDLKSALAAGEDPMGVTATISSTDDPVNLNENNVDLTRETTLAVETQLHFDLATRAVSDRFSLLRTAIGGA